MEWLNEVLKMPLSQLVLLPLGYAAFRFLEYLFKRKVEGSSDARDLDSLHRAADLREKLSRQNASIEDLKAFRQQALNSTVDVAVQSAQQAVERAQYLAHVSEEPNARDWPQATTQAEMNQQAHASYLEVEGELNALLLERLATADTDEAESLQRTHAAWIEWRDAEAEWDARTWEGGSIRPLLVSSKLEQLTRERIATLRTSGSLEQDPNALRVPYRRTPIDLADHIEPGTTATRVRELIGEPHFRSAGYWHYRFLETRLEIQFGEDETVQEYSFAVVEGQTYAAVVAHEGFHLGELTFGDLREFDPGIEVVRRTSLRTAEIYTSLRVGPPGAWTTLYFGAVIPFHGSNLMNTDFDWDFENERLREWPTNTKINWFGQTSSIDDAPYASWYVR